jgi:hypothetical protein
VTVYRSPSSGSLAAATTPARLAQEFDHVLWRELPQGGIEVAARRKDKVDRLRVHQDGSTSHLSTVTLRSTRWASTLAMIGIALALTALGSLFVGVGTGMLKLFFAGLALFLLGWIGSLRSADVRNQLGSKSDWQEPTDLNGWAPQTLAQLTAVERIADEHEGLALVRDVGAATIDVCAPRKGRLDRYVLDSRGVLEQIEEASSGLERVCRRLLTPIVLVAWFGLPAAGSHFGWAGVTLGLAIAIAAVTWLAQQTPERRLQRGQTGANWVEIRTRVEDSD